MDIKSLKNKRLIFTVTTGRSGTGLLAESLQAIPRTIVFHEATPGFHEHMRNIIDNKEEAKEFLLQQKLPSVAALSSDIYIETSHVFCKGFFEPLLELGIIPDLILLKRPEREIAKSLYQLGTIPGRDSKALKFYLAPEDPITYLPLPNWQDMHDYQLCFWYTLEITRRQYIYGQLVSALGGKVVEVTLYEISKGSGIRKITEKLDLPSLPFWESFRKKKKKVNTKSKRKKEFNIPDTELFEMEKEIYNATNFFGVNIY